MRVKSLILPILGALVFTGAPAALAAGGGAGVPTSAKKTVRAAARAASSGLPASGGASIAQLVPASTASRPIVPGTVGKIIHGLAYAPADAPIQVQRAIWAGNQIRHKPYVYGGGHGSFNDVGYDCSGSVSYLLHGAGLLSAPLDSSDFMNWARAGHGQWITIYTNPGHAFIEIAGIRLDTSSEGDSNGHSGSGPRWRALLQDTSGYDARHPSGM